MDETLRLYDIFLSFLRTGLILIGGGYVILPILQTELVENKNWLTSSELTDYYALSQSLPGLIAINISIFAGYKLKGFWGAVSAVCGLTFPAFWIIVLLYTILDKVAECSILQGAFKGVEIAVIILIISAVDEMREKSLSDKGTVIIFVFSLAVMIIFKLSPAWIIASAVLCSILFKKLIKSGG